MRGFKRTISILLSLLIILSVFTTAPFTVNAEQTTDLSPAYVAYQAKRYSDPNGQNLFGDASRTYAQTYYNQMKKDNKVISGITIWEAAHIATSPTYSLESGLITKKDMYKLAIFDMLDLSESDTFVSNLLDMVNDSRLSYIVSVSKSICDPNDINVSELKNFEVNAEYINFLKESAKLAKAFDVVDKISTIASGCKNLYEAILTTANYQAISDMKNGTKEVLSAIYADTSNPSELRQAAYECVNNFGDGFDRILNTVSTGSNLCLNATLETIFKEAVDSIWSEIISVIPGGKVVMTAAKGMRVLSNAVFAMDDTCRIYYQFEADVTLEQAVRNVMNNARCDYIQDNNQDKAIAYMRAVEMYKRIVLQGYDYTKEMLEIKANAPATKWFDWFNHDYSECMELMEGVESIKNNKQKLYKQFEDWVHSDYINLYCKDYNETINDFNNQQTIKTDSVTLTQIKDINVGDSGYIYDYIMKTCQPENSTEYKKCYFTAENKDAFTIDKLGSFVAESAGQVTLIYDKGGELESSVTITVGSSPTDNKHDYYSDFKYSTFYNNSQQRTEATITEYTGSQSNLIIPYSIDGYIVTSIGRRTFIGCTSLKSINIPDSVTNIDDSAFYGCTSLTSINIPDGVTSIGDWAFEGCTSLTSINIPDGVTCIGGWAFKGCSSLTSINIPDSVTNIGDSAFYGCTSLTSITIPDGITSIGDSTFRSCTSLTSINIPDSVKSIGNFTFSGCTNLTSINIPDGVTSIGGDAFSSCTSLTSITIPNSVTSIGDSAFYGCTNLTSINIPDGVTSIGYSAFYGCTSLTSINIPVDVTSIGDTTFYGCTSLTSVTVGNSVTSIGYSTFYGCTNLTSINIPDSLISIGSWAFDDCKSLTNITIPDSVISIGNYAFSGCSNLTSIKIPDSVTNIGDSAFYDCTSLSSVTVGNSVTSIGDSAFEGCTNLTSINIPDSVKSMGNFFTFRFCTSLTSINIPDGVTSIGDSTFSGCTNLTSINIPNSVTSIGDSAFSGCTSLTSINIPNSVTSIGDSAFDDCKSLTSINIPDGVTSIGYSAFYDCKSLTNITIPDGVTSIGNYAFSGCSSLTSIKIPNSVTSIGDAANYDLSDVLFMGSKEQWNSITMVSDNFSNAAIHYNAEYIKTVEPDCTNKGYDLYSCSECENGVKVNFTDALGHDFINGICERCGKDELDCIESAHPYENDTDEKWTIHKNNAKRIAVVFSDKTETESGSDYIYIYDKDNEEIGCYSGTELAGKRIVVQGDTVTIRLTSDSSNTCYGFDITDVKPYYEECVHSETELINVREAGCGWEGYTGDVRCVECQEILSYGKYIDATEEHSIISEIIPPTCGQEGYTHHYCENCDYSYDDNYVDATGNHEFENGICKICGQPDIDCLENFKANDTKNIEITNGGEFKYFKFTPNKNGTLNFYSVGTCDTYGCLFDSEMTELAYNDDGSEDYNFSITYDVIAGKTYILACRMYSSDTIGNFNTVLNFEPDDTALIGDVDGNGEVSIADATEIQKYLVQYVSFNEEQLKVSDTNGDGKVDIKDVTQIQKYIVQLISSLV